MIVGLTYDLRSDYLKEGYTEEETAEFDRESTIDEIEKSLHELGFKTNRIGHFRRLVDRVARGDRWDLVFNICEGMFGIGREAQVPALLDAYRIPYTFSDPLVLSVTLHKGLTKRIIRDGGIATAPFLVATRPEDLKDHSLTFPLFVKPNAEGTGKGINAASRTDNQQQLEQVCATLLKKYPGGLIIEEYLPGREFTAGITGTGESSEVIGVMEIIYRQESAGSIYSYDTKSNYEVAVEYQVPETEIWNACAGLALNAWRLLECRDAGRIDIRLDRSGVPNFIEVNPLAGLDKVHSDLPILAYKHGFTFTGLIGKIMESARRRVIERMRE